MTAASSQDHPPGRTADPSAFTLPAADAPLPDLFALLKSPGLEETALLALLARNDLPGILLEELARRRDWLRIYKVRRAMAFHLNVPRPIVARLLHDLYLMDLVALANAPANPSDVRRAAEDAVIAQLPRLPLGQKIALARQAPAQILGALLLEGHPKTIAPALANPRLTEAQVLKTLAREELTRYVLPAVAKNASWSARPLVRMALLRHPKFPLEIAISFLPKLPAADLRALASQPNLSAALRRHVAHEIARHSSAQG